MDILLRGGVILLHAYERYEHGHSSYIFFLVAGLVFLNVAFFHHQLEKKFPRIDILFFLVEATLSFIIAYEYFHTGKAGLPIMYLFAGLMQIVTVFIFLKKAAGKS